jgi:hypothetical protein
VDLHELAIMVYQMREAQKTYFRTKDQTVLFRSKTLERKVDEALEALKAGPTLFEEQSK